MFSADFGKEAYTSLTDDKALKDGDSSNSSKKEFVPPSFKSRSVPRGDAEMKMAELHVKVCLPY